MVGTSNASPRSRPFLLDQRSISSLLGSVDPLALEGSPIFFIPDEEAVAIRLEFLDAACWVQQGGRSAPELGRWLYCVCCCCCASLTWGPARTMILRGRAAHPAGRVEAINSQVVCFKHIASLGVAAIFLFVRVQGQQHLHMRSNPLIWLNMPLISCVGSIRTYNAVAARGWDVVSLLWVFGIARVRSIRIRCGRDTCCDEGRPLSTD